MNVDQLWARIAVETCILRGIEHFFLAPGSRCTPLTLSVAQHPDAIVQQHFDERGLAYALLGYGRATGVPGVLICTSGTAVANLLPAIVEASHDNVPMLVMTADRPPELRGVGANQAIDQVDIFGNYPRWFVDMPCPTPQVDPRFVTSQVSHGLAKAATGPAHMNWMFREPFSVDDDKSDVAQHVATPAPVLQAAHQTICVPAQHAVMVLGACQQAEARSAIELANKSGVVAISDVTSGICCGSLELPAHFELPPPRTIVHVGGRIVSKTWTQYVEQLQGVTIIRLAANSARIDPYHRNVQNLVTPLSLLHETVTLIVESEDSNQEFLQAWQSAQTSRQASIKHQFKSLGPGVSEPAVAHVLCQLLPDQSGFFLGNSTPIRDVNWFANWDTEKRIHVASNRGASGIDGLIATAVGFATGLKLPTTALLGDLAALHDLNSLAYLGDSNAPIVLIIVNNHGGGIFDMLPVATQSSHFEQFFATPHTFSFADAARMFAIEYRRPDTLSAFSADYQEAVVRPSPTIIEVETDRVENMMIRRKINAAIQ